MEKERNKDYFLWKSFKEGDKDAFYRLYNEYIDALFRFGVCFSKDQDLIKDCIHDLFLDLFKYRGQLSDTDSIKPYLFRSLRRKIHKEQTKIFLVTDADHASFFQSDYEQAYEDSLIKDEMISEKNKLLEKAMKLLTDGQRETLFLKFDQNLSYAEIAGILNISVESVRTSIYRSLKILRKSIQKNK